MGRTLKLVLKVPGNMEKTNKQNAGGKAENLRHKKADGFYDSDQALEQISNKLIQSFGLQDESGKKRQAELDSDTQKIDVGSDGTDLDEKRRKIAEGFYDKTTNLKIIVDKLLMDLENI